MKYIGFIHGAVHHWKAFLPPNQKGPGIITKAGNFTRAVVQHVKAGRLNAGAADEQ